MNYAQLKSAAFATADRTDVETISQYDNFLMYVEAKINRVLSTMQMTSRVSIATVADQEYYGLPVDFNGARDITIEGTNTTTGLTRSITLQYRTLSQLNDIGNNPNQNPYGDVYYNIINEQLRIQPPQENNSLQIIYYKNVPALTQDLDSNWVSEESPDCYVYGLLAQISAFNKDYDAAATWSAEFDRVISEIDVNDFDTRWYSSEPLQQRAS